MGQLESSYNRRLKKITEKSKVRQYCSRCTATLKRILMKNWVMNSLNASGAKKIACAGGLFLNVKANKILREIEDIEEIFFYPAPDDEEYPVGALVKDIMNIV